MTIDQDHELAKARAITLGLNIGFCMGVLFTSIAWLVWG